MEFLCDLNETSGRVKGVSRKQQRTDVECSWKIHVTNGKSTWEDATAPPFERRLPIYRLAINLPARSRVRSHPKGDGPRKDAPRRDSTRDWSHRLWIRGEGSSGEAFFSPSPSLSPPASSAILISRALCLRIGSPCSFSDSRTSCRSRSPPLWVKTTMTTTTTTDPPLLYLAVNTTHVWAHALHACIHVCSERMHTDTRSISRECDLREIGGSRRRASFFCSCRFITQSVLIRLSSDGMRSV